MVYETLLSGDTFKVSLFVFKLYYNYKKTTYIFLYKLYMEG